VPRRPRRGAFGLGGRIVGAVLVTTVATLAVAAIALLGPLEQGLRNAALKTLVGDVKGSTASFKAIDLKYVAAGPKDPNFKEGKAARHALAVQQQVLGTRIGATVELLDNPDVSGHGYPVLPRTDPEVAQSDPDLIRSDPYDDVAKAFLTGKPVEGFGSLGGTEYARVALPITIGHPKQRYVLAIRRPIDEVRDAVAVVHTAFITAAIAGLALTLILGIPLAARLVRRLRRLRQAALHLANEGPEVEVPVDRARDEVGDLARSLAIMQRRLQHQEEARRAFVATASHELRTPLTSLEGMLELLDDDLLDDQPDLEDARSLVGRARAQSRRLGRLAADLLDLSRLDAEVKLRSEPVELGELSRAVLAEFELGISERRITPLLEDSEGPVWVLGDPGSVARILRILLDNAFRLSPEGSEITVELESGPSVALSVCDDGPGVPLEERAQIFRRFHRGRETGGQGGFGLGLAIGRELAERMGGELVLRDTGGRGAKFTLRLPAARAPDQDPVAVL
jgi:signal transduction histidine kinase